MIKSGKNIWNRFIEVIYRIISLHWIRDAWMYLVRIIERMEDNHIFLSAGSIAFSTLLCFIPLILIIFYLLGLYLDPNTALSTIDSYLDSLQLFPFQKEKLREIIQSLMKEFVGGSHLAGVIGGIGLVWTASALFATLRTVLNRIYNIKDTKNVLVSKLKDFALLSIVGIALIVITILTYGMTVIQSVGTEILGKYVKEWMLHGAVTHGTSFGISFLLFCFLFLLIPDKRLPLRAIALSSGLAALLWGVAKFIFGYYLTNLWSIGKIYGPYAILVAAAIWVYYSSITLLLSAEIGEMYLERRHLKRLFKESEMKKLTESIHELDLTFLSSQEKDTQL